MMQPSNQPWAGTLKRRTVKLGFWTTSWLAATALMSFGPELWWQQTELSIAAFVLYSLVGGLMVHANLRQVQAMDELERKIFLDAAAITLGVGLVCGIGYSLLVKSGLLSGHADIANLVLLMGLTFIVNIWLGRRRFQ